MLLAWALVALGIYLVVLLLVYVTQSWQVHQPSVLGRELEATPSAIGLRWEDISITTADGVSLHGWYLPAQGRDSHTVLFFHGNAGNISQRLETLEVFHSLGLATLIIDYRGFGRSEGHPSEAGLYRDADAAWQYLVRERQLEPHNIIPFGRSLGAPVAAHLAAQRPVGGLVLESAFTSVPDLAAEIYWFLPVRQLARLEYPTREWVQQVEAPVLVIHSEDDELVPFQHGKAIYEAAPEPKRLLRIQGDHNTGFIRSHAVYTDGLASWLASVSQ